MAASVQFRPQNRDLGMVMREVDEDLAIFLGIKNDNFLAQESDRFDEKCVEPKPVSLLASNAPQAETCLVVDDDNFLNSEMEKSDHDWLLKQPDSSLLPSLDADAQESAANKTKVSNGEDIVLKSEVEKSCEISASPSESSSPLASVEQKPSRRDSTPTGQQPSLSSAKSRSSRVSTPTSRATLLPPSKPIAAQARSLTPIKPSARLSTPASRPSMPVVLKSGPRSATPTRKPATASTTPNTSASRGSFPALKSRPSKPSDMLLTSQDVQQSMNVSMPKRPASASRGRIASSQLSFSNEKPRQKSCSPAKFRAPISTSAHKTGSKMLSRSRGYNNDGDDVNPVVLGTKMVDRVVNMRKLAPPKQDEYVSQENPKKSSQENSGFGRSLSKKSLEMAIRHMDIRRSIPDKSRTSEAGDV